MARKNAFCVVWDEVGVRESVLGREMRCLVLISSRGYGPWRMLSDEAWKEAGTTMADVGVVKGVGMKLWRRLERL